MNEKEETQKDTEQTNEQETAETGAEGEEKSNELKSALAQKDHFREKFEKAEVERKALEEKLNAQVQGSKKVLDVEDYIDISASLEGLDQREKEFLAKQHKLTGEPLKAIRESEDFGLWQGSYRQKVEKERALKPSGVQTEADKPQTLTEKLAGASMAEKEKLLIEAGYYKTPRTRPDRVDIGRKP